MRRVTRSDDAAWTAVWAALGAATAFEAQALLDTQSRTVRAASPWQDDPYHSVVFLAALAVPVLAAAVAARLLLWRAPGGPDRARQTARAAATAIVLVTLALGFEWAAFLGRRHHAVWSAWTWVLVAGAAAASVLTVPAGVLLARCRLPRADRGPWRHDWLDDAIALGGLVPGLRHRATPEAAAWVRRHATGLIVALSTLAAAAGVTAQAVGEDWTDPLLIGWALVALTASNVALCAVANAVAGFVARPPRSRNGRVAEVSLVAGCVAVPVAVAFHGALWSAVGHGALTSVPALAALTLGAGTATSALTAGVLLIGFRRTARG
ncbi:hypothetical protein [Actinacidiphila acidipaludis]|uniref:Integral membrane protein n=1 Tax=Actinacidiphila acidipaludis TaxID=2873382 RepID=A0ABS7QJN9_9ACTN|nr:hypothetical protein [Streptomyces acidipaludis]MBY8882137.1 hypothetical protein [Streptomyces acidipaludis]